MKIDAKMGIKSKTKNDVWAIWGPTFEVLGGFLRSLIFDEFSIGETSASNRQNWRLGAATRASARFLGQGRRDEAVASRGFWSLTGTGRSLQKASRTPCSPQGGRRIYGLPPRPPTSDLYLCFNVHVGIR